SLMEGDSVTLHTGVTKIQGSDQIVWKFGDQVIPITNLNSAADERWSNIHLNDQTRDLTIRNIRRDQSGDYKVEANTISMILHRNLDGVKKISVRDGDPVPLQTRVTDITGNDVIEWTFGPQNTSIVKTDRVNGRIIYNEHDVRFTNTLHLDIKTGDLTISNTKTDNAGLYHIKITKSMYAIQKSFSVTVSGEYFVSFIFVLCESGYIVLIFLVFVRHTLTLMTVSLYHYSSVRCSFRDICFVEICLKGK
uniref:Immunoglobulin domain-containing protein n=1 Tax=Cyprinus carpio TaxID=7962 RepID=A0A8C1MW19_CYPCA